MHQQVLNVIERWQSDERLTTLEEARICSAVIEPILRGLDWDIGNPQEVWEQYSVEDIGTVDYALLIGDKPKVFVEVKRGGAQLKKHQSQLRNYARIGGVSLAILTNGATWWFYLPLQEGSWERTRIGEVEFQDQNTAEIAQRLVDLLSRENVSSENAIQNAENLQKKNQILEALPKAWEQLVNNKIPNLLAAQAQELCGHKPSKNEVEQFLSSRLQQIQITPHPAPVPSLEPNPSLGLSPSGSVTGKKIVGFTFDKRRYEVRTWREMIAKLCEIVHKAQSDRFDEILNLRGTRGKVYFSKDSSELHRPMQISGTDIFVTDLYPTKTIKQIARRLITHFGYDENDLVF